MKDLDIIIYFVIALIVIFGFIYLISKRKDKEPFIKQLQVIEQEIEVDNRFLLVAIYNNGERRILNKDKPLNIKDMESYFESELEKLCTK